MSEFKNDQIIALSLEVIEDAEMLRTSVEALVLKASRLARLVDDEDAIQWLHWERVGYIPEGSELQNEYLVRTKRKISQTKWMPAPLADLENGLNSIEGMIRAAESFRPSGSYAIPQFNNQQKRMIELNSGVADFRRVVSAVRMNIQDFATRTYHERLFSHEAASIFEEYQGEVDVLLASTAQTAFTRYPRHSTA